MFYGLPQILVKSNSFVRVPYMDAFLFISWYMLIYQHVPRWHTIYEILSFYSGEVEMFVLLRFGIVSLGDSCPLFQDSKVV